MTEHTLITPRRNFLIRALGFTVAGATVPISIITADDAKARITHHQRELEKAWREYYGPAAAVRTYADVRPSGATYASRGKDWPALSSFLICASEVSSGAFAADWAVESLAWKCKQLCA